MLNLFNSFTVPGVEHVTMYHDDERESVFYMMPTRPRFAVATDGGPLVNILAFARDLSVVADDATKLPAGETEGGIMSLSVELSVEATQQERIRAYIREELWGAGPLLVQRFRPDSNALAFEQIAAPPAVELRYPMWVDGTVKCTLFPATDNLFVRAVEGSQKPSLIGENMASWTLLFGQMGVRLLRDAVENGASPGVVHYDLMYAARFPSLHIQVHGDRTKVYEEIRDRCTVTERYGNNTWTYPQISSLQELSTMITSLQIVTNVNDIKASIPNDPSSAAAAKLEQIALDLVQTIISKEFLQSGFEPGLKLEKLGTDPFAHNPNRPPGEAPRNGNVLWLRDFTQSMTGTLDVTFDANRTSTFPASPNALLFEMLDPQMLKKRTVTGDANTPIFSIPEIPVSVTADFEHDPIAEIHVTCEYEQLDEPTQKTKSLAKTFVFSKGGEKYYFRPTLAFDARGVPKREWSYRSTVHYKASGKKVDTPQTTTTDRALLLGYDRLDFLDVRVQAGAIDWTTVKAVSLHLHRVGATDADDAHIVLTGTHTEDAWLVAAQGGEHRFECTQSFTLVNGQMLKPPMFTTAATRLVVDAPFEDRVEATFVAQGAFPPIKAIVVSTRYVDEANDFHVQGTKTLQATGEYWTWSVQLRDSDTRTFQYKADVLFADGSASEGAWADGEEGTNLVGEVAGKILSIEVSPVLIDFTKWKLVIVELRKGLAEKTFKFVAGEPPGPSGLVWTTPAASADDRTYTAQVTAFPVAGGPKTVVGPVDTTDSVFVVEL
jgi:hypothetical protein